MSKPQDTNSFKVIVAIKCAKEHGGARPPSVRCTISIQDKQKSSTLPFSEGQFFDLRELDVNRPIALTFYLEKSNKEIGTSFISIPESILTKEELEIADDFVFNYTEKDFEGVFRGSYYIIILNKRAFLQKDDSGKKQVQFNKDESPKPQQLKTQASMTAKSPGVNKKPQNSTQVQKQTREDELKRQNSAKKLQERVEASVKNAQKEMQTTKQLEAPKRQQTVVQDLDGQSPTRLSNTVQLTRSGTVAQTNLNESQEMSRSGASPQRMQTFNIDDSPSKLNRSTTSVSPGRHQHHHDGYNPHAHSTLACLYYIDQANMSDQLKTQADYFKKMIYNLQSKIDGLKSIEKANDRLVAEVKRQEQQIKDLEKLLGDAQDNFRGLRADINSSMDQAFEERQDLEAKLRSKTDQCNELEKKNANLEHKLEQAQNQIIQMDRRLTELLALSRQAKQNEQKLDENDRTILENLRAYENKIRELQQTIGNLEKQRAEVQADLNKANQNIVGLKSDLSDSNHKNKELTHEIGTLERKLQVYKAQESTIKAQADQIAQLQKDLIEAARQKQHVEGEAADLRKDLNQSRNQLANQEKNNNDRMNALRQKIVEAESRINQIQNELDVAQKDSIKQRHEIKDLHRDAKLQKDLQNQIETEKNKNSALLKQVKDSQNREKDMSENYRDANAQLYQARQEINDLQQELLETQQYCAQLKKLILEMKETGAAYIPFHNDPIDKALSDFINSLNDPERIKDLFVRESEGVYIFGTKKVYAKIEQDRILIRAGGGFLGVEEFLDLYAAAEIEKMEKNDPRKSYDQNRALQSKVDSGKIVRENKRQQSPLRSKSPM